LDAASYLVFTIRDSEGNIIRRLKQTPAAGINRIVWDMRYPSSDPVTESTDPNKHSALPVVPGKYSVSMEMVSGQNIKELATRVEFICKPLNNRTLPAQDEKALADFQRKVTSMSSQLAATKQFVNDLQTRIKVIKTALNNTYNANLSLLTNSDIIANKLNELSKILTGDASIAKRAGNQPMSLSDRVEYIIFTMYYSSSAPTSTNFESYKIADSIFDKVLADLKSLYENEYKKLESELDNLGAPWTPGRFPIRKK
jgi:hypothetical protein